MFRKNMGIDLGTSSVLIYVRGKGIVLREPAVVAIDKKTMKILKVGFEAQEMLGRTPKNIAAVHPMRDGIISDYDSTEQMLRYFIRKANGNSIFPPNAVVCVPSRINEVEERAVRQAVTNAGAKNIELIEEPMAAALGAGLDIGRPRGIMVIDIGGGTVDIAVICLNDIVVSESVKCGGNKFDEEIVKYVRKEFSCIIGERTAEDIKIKIGCVSPRAERLTMNGASERIHHIFGQCHAGVDPCGEYGGRSGSRRAFKDAAGTHCGYINGRNTYDGRRKPALRI